MTILEKYQHGIINIYDAINLLNHSNITNNKKNDGVFYTPEHIVDYIISQLDYSPEKTILEPSVGHGVFIFKLIEHVEKKFKLSGNDLKYWFENYVFCFDINEQNISDFTSLLTIFFSKREIYNVDFKNIIVADTLFYHFNKRFDFSFGNPPYVRVKNIGINYLSKLKNKYKSCQKGNIDLYYAFVEMTISISDRSCFIVPNSYTFNKSAFSLREIMKERIDKIIDFKTTLIFNEAKTYTSIYSISKDPVDNIEYSTSIEDEPSHVKKNSTDHIWFSGANELKKTGRFNDETYIYSGVATLRDKFYTVFNLDEKNIDGKPYYEREIEDRLFYIEKEACVSFYKMTKRDKKFKMIFPYRSDMKIIKEIEFSQKYPKALEYLTYIKDELARRDKGNVSKYEEWFAYGRKQGMKPLTHNYFVFVPLMFNQKLDVKIIKNEEFFLFVSGFSIGVKDREAAERVAHFINEYFFDFVKANCKVWPGKEPFYSYTKNQLETFLAS